MQRIFQSTTMEAPPLTNSTKSPKCPPSNSNSSNTQRENDLALMFGDLSHVPSQYLEDPSFFNAASCVSKLLSDPNSEAVQEFRQSTLSSWEIMQLALDSLGDCTFLYF